MMKILFIAPIPPPVDGQSKASKVLLDVLINKHDIAIINLSKSSLGSSLYISRLIEIFKIINEVSEKTKTSDIIYLSIAESFAGNMRDLLIYYICRKKLNKTYIHILGGAGLRKIFSRNTWQKRFNVKFIRKLGGVIIEGPVNYDIFKEIISENKIHIVPNFAEDFLFVTDEEIEAKFENIEQVVQILYLSNLIFGKGYDELADAYLSLNKNEQKNIKINFVGRFENENSEKKFLSKIENNSGITYLGKFIDGKEKRDLYCKSHIFCLPTYYPYEGQPISILESYATGCAVITTNHSGIPFIFRNDKNGFIVEKKSIPSLTDALKKILSNKSKLKNMAFYNRDEAYKKYRTNTYQNKILKILE